MFILSNYNFKVSSWNHLSNKPWRGLFGCFIIAKIKFTGSGLTGVILLMRLLFLSTLSQVFYFCTTLFKGMITLSKSESKNYVASRLILNKSTLLLTLSSAKDQRKISLSPLLLLSVNAPLRGDFWGREKTPMKTLAQLDFFFFYFIKEVKFASPSCFETVFFP